MGSKTEYEEFCSKFEIADEVGEDRGDPIEALARLLISITENSLQDDVASDKGENHDC